MVKLFDFDGILKKESTVRWFGFFEFLEKNEWKWWNCSIFMVFYGILKKDLWGAYEWTWGIVDFLWKVFTVPFKVLAVIQFFFKIVVVFF